MEVKREDNSCILAFSCFHAPYQHKLALKFLDLLKQRFKPTRIICLGDEVDQHATSYHENSPELDGAGAELKQARRVIGQLEAIFPEMDIMESNHGSMYFRKAKTAGIPREALKGYNDILQVGDGWKWHNELAIRLPNGQDCLFKHQVGANVLNAAKERKMNIVQGHYHTTLNAVAETMADNDTIFGATCGCLIDNDSMAYAYNKTQMKLPKYGAIIIYDGKPIMWNIQEFMHLLLEVPSES